MPITLKRERVYSIPWTTKNGYKVWTDPLGAMIYRVEGLPDWFELPLMLRHKFGRHGSLLKSGPCNLRPMGLLLVQAGNFRFQRTTQLRFTHRTLKDAEENLSRATEQDLQLLYFQFLLRIALGPDRDKLTETQLAAAYVASHTIPHERRT